MPGPFIADPDKIAERPQPFGNGQCVALVQAVANVPNHSLWQEGPTLADAIRQPEALAKGTAIATFIDGVYPSRSSGNHAAIFVSAADDFSSVTVFDQWAGQPPHFRPLMFNRTGKHDAVDKAESYSIIL